MDAPKVGSLITGEAKRDAFHVAVAPVTANERLAPGQDVGFAKEDNRELVGPSNKPLGIVDPLLRNIVQPGEKFYLWIYPNTVTSLRHEWTHPSFDNKTTKDKSIKWLQNHAEEIDITYSTLLRAAENYITYGEYTTQYGRETWRDGFNAEEFWKHYEIVTGETVKDHEAHIFSCSC